jgi:hypothetical protein
MVQAAAGGDGRRGIRMVSVPAKAPRFSPGADWGISPEAPPSYRRGPLEAASAAAISVRGS